MSSKKLTLENKFLWICNLYFLNYYSIDKVNLIREEAARNKCVLTEKWDYSCLGKGRKMGKITAQRVSQPWWMSFFTVLFADVGSNECANHVGFQWLGFNITMWELYLIKIETLQHLGKSEVSSDSRKGTVCLSFSHYKRL